MHGRQAARPRSFIIRVLRCDHHDWQGQLVDVASGTIYPFASFLQLQRLMLAMVEAAGNVCAAPGPGGTALPSMAPVMEEVGIR